MFSVLQASLDRRGKNPLSSKSAYWKVPSSQRTLTFGLGFLA